MLTVSYVCECGSTGGEKPEGPLSGCLVCGKALRAYSIKVGKPPRPVTRCGVDALHVENERWSWSMGIAPEDIPKAMKMYPGSEYNAEGQLRVASRHDKIKKMRQRGLVECDGFRHRDGIKAKRRR